MSDRSVFRVQLLGTSFTIQADEDTERLDRIVRYLRGKTDQVEKSLGTKDPLKTSLISAILIVDELFKEKEKGKDSPLFDKEAEELTLKILEKLDHGLLDNN